MLSRDLRGEMCLVMVIARPAGLAVQQLIWSCGSEQDKLAGTRDGKLQGVQ